MDRFYWRIGFSTGNVSQEMMYCSIYAKKHWGICKCTLLKISMLFVAVVGLKVIGQTRKSSF
jgi:hypothetical protein